MPSYQQNIDLNVDFADRGCRINEKQMVSLLAASEACILAGLGECSLSIGSGGMYDSSPHSNHAVQRV